jgi:hypothetical protein
LDESPERIGLVSARLELPLLDPQLGRYLRIIVPHLCDEALGVLASDKHLEINAERDVRRKSIVDDRVEDHGETMTRSSSADKMAVRDIVLSR